MYGIGHNEELVGKAIKGRREKVILATKFGIVRGKKGEFLPINGKPDYVRSACEASLRRLNIDVIDLYFQHRVDPNTPIEETVGAMANWSKRKSPLPRLLKRRLRPSAGHMKSTPLPHWSPNIRYGRAMWKRRSCLRCGSWA
jgi:hypothetical protein